MLDTAAHIAVLGIVAIIVGAPAAVLVRRRADGWIALLADALPLGLGIVASSITAVGWLGIGGGIGAAVAWVALIGWAIARRTPLPAVPAIPRGRRLALPVSWAAVLVLAFILRVRQVDFLPWVGDMGAYVNWANEFARTGELHASWPPLFPALLTWDAALWGSPSTASSLGITGIALLVAIVRLAGLLGVRGWTALALGGLVAVQPHLVWFSTFASSESLNAPLFVVWVRLLADGLGAARDRLGPLLVLQALTAAQLSLLRGSGVLLVIPGVVMLAAALVVGVWRPLTARLLASLAALAAGVGVGYWYGVAEIPRYFVSMQIGGLAPQPVIDAMRSLGLLAATPAAAALCVLPPLALLGLALLAHRRIQPTESGRRIALVAGLLLAAVLAVGVILVVAVGAQTGATLLRMGIWWTAAAIVALALLPARIRPDRALVLGLLGVTSAMFIALHTLRLGLENTSAYYLYWDRYLVSETLPAILVIAAVGLAALLSRGIPRGARAVLAAALAVTIVVPSIPSLALQARGQLMTGASSFVGELAAVAEQSVPRMWTSSDPSEIDDWFFPNTWMAFAVPLQRSYGIDMVDTDQARNNFAPDRQLDAERILDFMACRPDADEFVIYEVRNGGPGLDEVLTGSPVQVADPQTVRGSLELLAQPPDAGWTTARFEVVAWHATADREARSAGVCPTAR
ncbi:hypothetical protein [Homoserinibacter sp. GY 40078]|uniref:hypothetical protein n=1 Tax=Homoserinibacter sp. GY 40078 TaxID=2603275 RepID=UPI0011C84D86|nr:hypothetical protein [Homoserinibacter sp. GY 40078]TXK16263.1 hypothetical protein FVQ89_13480 [Homoserinibacter sp. GY 40078]